MDGLEAWILGGGSACRFGTQVSTPWTTGKVKKESLPLCSGFNCVGAGEASPDAEVGKELPIPFC